jgi:predicted Fe-Mo cluster-binding NifX family protein
MRIAISATGRSLDAKVEPHFGRCWYLVVVDTETMQYETIDNAGVLKPGCVGIRTSQLIANKWVDAVITGNCGPNTYKVLDAAGVKLFVGAEGTVREAVEACKEGKLKVISQPNVTAGAGSNKNKDK